MKLAPEKRDRPVVADVGTAAAAAAAAMVAEIAASAEISKIASIHFRRRGREFGQGWIRTSEGVKPADLQSAPFGHFGTYPRAFDITHALPLASGADKGLFTKTLRCTLPRTAALHARSRDRLAAPGSRGRRFPLRGIRPGCSRDIRNTVARAVRADSKLPFQFRVQKDRRVTYRVVGNGSHIDDKCDGW